MSVDDQTAVYQIRAQIKGWKNKLHHVYATSFDDARRQAREFFEGDWKFSIESQPDDGPSITETDEGFDLEWEES